MYFLLRLCALAIVAFCAPAAAHLDAPSPPPAQFQVSFPSVHPHAQVLISLQRTLRVPDDGKSYPLPPGLGMFAAEPEPSRLAPTLLVPMLQSEAMWLSFQGHYPVRIRVLSGRIDAVSGAVVDLAPGALPGGHFPTDPQGYVVAPPQPWLDGFRTAEGYVRQWVAEPLKTGRTAEEQLASSVDPLGGLWIGVEPLRAEHYEPPVQPTRSSTALGSSASPDSLFDSGSSMGLAPGGTIVQQIFTDDRSPEHWSGLIVWHRVELLSSLAWVERTGHVPPQRPLDAQTYTTHGYPWFTYWDRERTALAGPSPFSALRSLAEWSGTDPSVVIPGSQVRDLSPPLVPSAIEAQ